MTVFSAFAIALGFLSFSSSVVAFAPIAGIPNAANAVLANLSSVRPSSEPAYLSKEYMTVCKAIKLALSNKTDFYVPINLFDNPNFQVDPRYDDALWHWAVSGSQKSACVVVPAVPEDISVVLKIAGAVRMPFGIRSGGHSPNPGFSSTPGVLIWMSKFNQVQVNVAQNTANIGPGQTWDNVYKLLEPYEVMVVGGRVSGVGVGGFSLGGGYSWKTSQYGLTSDNIVQYDLVLPTGELATATKSQNPDLFFALKGGLNKFGVVYNMVMKTHKQTRVYGGNIIYLSGANGTQGTNLTAIGSAIAKFAARNKDPRAVVLPTFETINGLYLIVVLTFYDGPVAPKGTFQEFLDIPSVANLVTTQKFTDFVAATPSHIFSGRRGRFAAISFEQFTEGVMAQVVNQTIYYTNESKSHKNAIISYDVEPFTKGLFRNSPPSAYPHTNAEPAVPLNLYFAWDASAPEEDAWYKQAMRTSIATLLATAEAENQKYTDVALYPNYALEDEPVSKLYGDSLPRLRTIRKQIDPKNVMGLAGGYTL